VSAEDERLLQLFQNRADLKKAYADLKNESYRLIDRLKQQEGATLRVQEQLDRLGDLLALPGTGFAALVFYQLRGLWKACHEQLAAFAAGLERAQEGRETARHRAGCDTARSVRLAELDTRLRSAVGRADIERRQLAAAENGLNRLTAIWHYFERRRRDQSMRGMRQAVLSADAAVGVLRTLRSGIEGEACEAFPGVSLAARRNINLAVLGYAELLCESVNTYGLASQAREAAACRVHEMSFGSPAECEERMQRVQQAKAAIAAQKPLSSSVKAKMELMRATCRYGNPGDTVPAADSLAPGAAWNVLAEDYWDVGALLMR
jgi:hypothetical protein